jgi:hypothetical protein
VNHTRNHKRNPSQLVSKQPLAESPAADDVEERRIHGQRRKQSWTIHAGGGGRSGVKKDVEEDGGRENEGEDD